MFRVEAVMLGELGGGVGDLGVEQFPERAVAFPGDLPEEGERLGLHVRR